MDWGKISRDLVSPEQWTVNGVMEVAFILAIPASLGFAWRFRNWIRRRLRRLSWRQLRTRINALRESRSKVLRRMHSAQQDSTSVRSCIASTNENISSLTAERDRLLTQVQDLEKRLAAIETPLPEQIQVYLTPGPKPIKTDRWQDAYFGDVIHLNFDLRVKNVSTHDLEKPWVEASIEQLTMPALKARWHDDQSDWLVESPGNRMRAKPAHSMPLPPSNRGIRLATLEVPLGGPTPVDFVMRIRWSAGGRVSGFKELRIPAGQISIEQLKMGGRGGVAQDRVVTLRSLFRLQGADEVFVQPE